MGRRRVGSTTERTARKTLVILRVFPFKMRTRNTGECRYAYLLRQLGSVRGLYHALAKVRILNITIITINLALKYLYLRMNARFYIIDPPFTWQQPSQSGRRTHSALLGPCLESVWIGNQVLITFANAPSRLDPLAPDSSVRSAVHISRSAISIMYKHGTLRYILATLFSGEAVRLFNFPEPALSMALARGIEASVFKYVKGPYDSIDIFSSPDSKFPNC